MTERLTDKNPCIKCDRPIYCGSCQEYDKWVVCVKKKLAEYETAEEEGRLVVLPQGVKVDDYVYEVYKIKGIGECAIDIHKIGFDDIHKIGKTIFLSHKEAEKAYKEMERNENN